MCEDDFMDTADLFKQILQNNYLNINSDEQMKNDDRLRMRERNEKYTEILNVYTINVKRVLLVKLIFRIIFLIVSIGALVGTFGLFAYILWGVITQKIKVNYVETIVAVLSSMVSLITVFIVLPQIMTKYLFDIEEEKNIYNVVKQIQDYDQIIRENLK